MLKRGRKMSKQKIIAIIGRIGSGKDTAAKFFEKKYGFQKIIMSNFLRAEAKRKKIHPTRQNLRKLQAELRKKHGKYYLVDLAIKKINNSGKNFIIDGLRDYSEAVYAKKKINLKIVFLETSQITRFKRIKNRGRKGDAKTYLEFVHQDAVEDALFSFPRTIKFADFKIDSEGEKKKLFFSLKKIFKKIK